MPNLVAWTPKRRDEFLSELRVSAVISEMSLMSKNVRAFHGRGKLTDAERMKLKATTCAAPFRKI
ncbi:hypothetical protein ACLK1T_19240 [Escherichia coli]